MCLDHLKTNQRSYQNMPNSSFEADSLKILNSGLFLKTFTHANLAKKCNFNEFSKQFKDEVQTCLTAGILYMGRLPINEVEIMICLTILLRNEHITCLNRSRTC